MAIKTKLHILMAERRMSQKQLADATGIRPSTISAYYNDNWKTISKEHIETLCRFFKCEITDLLELSKYKSGNYSDVKDETES